MAAIWTPTATALGLARQYRETREPHLLPILADAIEDGHGPQEWAARARGCDHVAHGNEITKGEATHWKQRYCPRCHGLADAMPSPAVASMVLACGGGPACDCRIIGGKRSRYVFAGPESHWEDCGKCLGTGAVIDLDEPLRAVCEAREWDAPRLLYADLIEPTDPQRAEFVRVQIELATVPRGHCTADCCTQGFGPCRWCKLRRRERELLKERFVDDLPFSGATQRLTNHVGFKVFVGADSDIDVIYRRGFVSEITCTWADWLRIADTVYWHPEQREACGGRPVWSQPKWQCGKCGGFGPYELAEGEIHRCQGTIPRPFPATAQPLEVVTTRPPDDWGDDAMIAYFQREWPGLQFTFAGQIL